MRIRKTSTGQYRGTRYYTHRLVQTTRVGKRTKEITLLNLGAHFSPPQEDWPAICQQIEELFKLDGQIEFDFTPCQRPDILAIAKSIELRLRKSKMVDSVLPYRKRQRRAE